MFQGMTGFGRAVRGVCRVEITTLNRRHLEMQVILPPSLQPMMVEIRKAVASRLKRGHVKVVVSYDPEQTPPAQLSRGRLEQLLLLADELCERAGVSRESALTLLWSGSDVVTHADEGAAKEVLPAVRDALDEVVAMRSEEGAQIGEELKERCDLLEKELATIASLAPVVLERHRAHLATIAPAELTEQILVKGDIAEEISRFELHLGQLRDCDSGKRADFLLQELLREANTLSAKAGDGEISGCAVRIKEELERLREQMQNVE